MVYNLAYKSRYHDDVRKQLERYGMPNHWEPDTARHTKRGGTTNNAASTHPWKNMSDYLKPEEYKDKKTYRSGNSIGWNYYNRNVLNEVNKMKEPYSFMQGGVTRPYYADPKPEIKGGPLKESILKTLSPEKRKIEGGLSLKKAERKLKRAEKKVAPISKRVGKKVASKSLDVAFDLLPTVASAAASETGPFAIPVGIATGVVSQKARKNIKAKTGFGGVGKYKPQEGGVSFKDVKKLTKKGVKIATPVAKKLSKRGVSKGLDLALDQGVGSLAKALAPELGLPPKETEQVAKALGAEARKAIKSRTGYGQKKKANPWIEHLKAYSKAHNISYREALKSKAAKDAYRK